MDKLESWDMAWAAEKLKQARYAFSDDEVKQYFPEPKVLAGLFRVIEALFGVQHRGRHGAGLASGRALLPHHRATASLIGQFYLDLYARDTKRGGAWMARRHRPPPDRRRHPDAGRLSVLQLSRAGGRRRTGGPPPSAMTTC